MIDAGLLTREELDECLNMSKETGLPIGKIFLLSGKTSESVLLASVQAQSLLKDGILELETAYKALRKVAKNGISLDEALEALECEVDEVKVNRLGDLLLEAKYVTEAQLDEAIQGSSSTGLPFGRMLVLNGILTEHQLAASLNAQILVRDKKINKEQAIEGLRQARRRQIAVEVPLMEKGFYKVQSRDVLRLGELLTLSGLVSESQILSAVEVGLVSQKPLGQVLVEQNLVDESTLQVALKIQELVETSSLNPKMAPQILVRATEHGMTIPDAIASVELGIPAEEENFSLKDFLLSTKKIDSGDLKTAFDKSINDNQILGRILLAAGMIDEGSLNVAMRLAFLVKSNLLDPGKAPEVFDYAISNKISADDALKKLNIQPKTN